MNILANISEIPKNNHQNQTAETLYLQNDTAKIQPYKPDVLDFLSEKVVNKNDLNDMVTTPRAIFKGYLCFTAGTMVNTIASFIKNNKVANPLKIIGCLTSIYGTYNFVKPYLIRNDKLTQGEK